MQEIYAQFLREKQFPPWDSWKKSYPEEELREAVVSHQQDINVEDIPF
jgi:hypothetical protein